MLKNKSENTFPKHWQSYLSVLNTIKRNRTYIKELNSPQLNKLIAKSPFLCDSKRSLHFLSVVYICNYLNKKSHLSLIKLINSINDINKKKELEYLLQTITLDKHYKNIFNLRDKYISHRDKDWFNFETKLPDDIISIFVNLIEKIIEEVFKFHSLPFSVNDFNEEYNSIRTILSTIKT